MSPFELSFDNIRLLRRKIRIEQELADNASTRAQRDEAIIRISELVDDLIRAMQDFADMGYEERVAEIIAAEVDPMFLRKVN